MLFRFISKTSHLRILTQISSQTYFSNPKPYPLHSILNSSIPKPAFNFFSDTSLRYFSTNNNNNGKDQSTSTSDLWKLSSESDQSIDSVFGEDTGGLQGIHDRDATANADVSAKSEEDESWLRKSKKREDFEDRDIFKGIGKGENGGGGEGEWATAEGYKPWNFVVEEKEEELFDVGGGVEVSEMQGLGGGDERVDNEKSEDNKQLEREEKALTAILKGPNRAFGDLIAASGITEAMLDSLIALKDMENIEGLPPLREIEDMRYEKNTRKSTRAEIERQKQEEVAKARVRQVDEKGRAYGTGKRKCSIARVWVQPGDGKFVVNDKEFDVYFPMLDHRAALLRPFSETKTLGLWDVSCTVKGGGVSGQVGAIQLGISRALQNWEPDLRPPLRSVGFLTRDSRVVERKKPGKAKARKSFQWVKR